MSELLDEPPRKDQAQPVKQQPSQTNYTNPSFVPKPTAPPEYPPPRYTVTQPYTYATMPPPPSTAPYGLQNQNHMPSWATPVYQTAQTVPRYVVQTPYTMQQYPIQYPPQQQQQSNGMAVAGGFLAGALVADMLQDDPY